MICTLNHGTQILAPTHSRMVLQITRKTMVMSNIYLLKYLKITTLPPQISRTKWGSPVEQPTESEEKNHEEIPQEICDDEAEVSRKTLKENTPEI